MSEDKYEPCMIMIAGDGDRWWIDEYFRGTNTEAVKKERIGIRDRITFNLGWICRNCGIREVGINRTQTRKIFRFLIEAGTGSEEMEVDDYINSQKNKAAKDCWSKEVAAADKRGRARRRHT